MNNSSTNNTNTNANGNGNTNMNSNNMSTSLKRPNSEMGTASSSRSNTGGGGGGGGGIDTHPYMRGSVIEVIYGVRKMEDSDMDEDFDDVNDEYEYDDDWNKKDEDKDKDKDNGGPVDTNGGTKTTGNTTAGVNTSTLDETEKKKVNNENQKEFEIRLADIIDRCQSDTPNHENPAYRYKYYIHYRDYNRRMDEWLTDPERIVSPPSVGNAKVREMKKAKAKAAKEEEERKAARERERLRLLMLDYKSHNSAAATATTATTSSSNSSAVGTSADSHNDASNNNIVANEEGKNYSIDNNNLSISPGGRTTSQRASSRRAVAAITNISNGTNSNNVNNNIATESKLLDDNNNNNVSIPTTAATRQRRKSTRGGASDDNDKAGQQQSQQTDKARSSNSVIVTTLLPTTSQDDIKDKVVTVAARELDEHEGLDEASLREHEEVTKVKNVAEVQLGKYRMNAWYFSPIPKELFQSGNTVDVLYVCEFTLQFFARKEELLRYQAKILSRNERHPPGNEIYRNGNLSMFEIDGFEERLYCQNLCYIAKLFLDHKTLYFDVDPFLFYVLCEVDERGFHPVGYYSKEKYSDVGFNLACILTFPCHQRKGYGRFLIDFSYELSKKEEKVGSPEKPSEYCFHVICFFFLFFSWLYFFIAGS
jgi:hypothetical protein